jgi:hypothetical protein
VAINNSSLYTATIYSSYSCDELSETKGNPHKLTAELRKIALYCVLSIARELGAAGRERGEGPALADGGLLPRQGPRVRSHCRFRNRGTEYVSESGKKWMQGSTKRQCDRALQGLLLRLPLRLPHLSP